MSFGNRATNKLTFGPRMKDKISPEEYDRQRQLRYTGPGFDRPARKDHQHYSTLTRESNRDNDDYIDLHTQERERFDDYGGSDSRYAAEKSFYREHREELFPEQHERLIEPSRKRHESSLSMANSRDRFLTDHPYVYRNYRERIDHEDLRDSASTDSLTARGHFDSHYRYAGDPASSRRDQYGRRMPRY